MFQSKESRPPGLRFSIDTRCHSMASIYDWHRVPILLKVKGWWPFSLWSKRGLRIACHTMLGNAPIVPQWKGRHTPSLRFNHDRDIAYRAMPQSYLNQSEEVRHPADYNYGLRIACHMMPRDTPIVPRSTGKRAPSLRFNNDRGIAYRAMLQSHLNRREGARLAFDLRHNFWWRLVVMGRVSWNSI